MAIACTHKIESSLRLFPSRVVSKCPLGTSTRSFLIKINNGRIRHTHLLLLSYGDIKDCKENNIKCKRYDETLLFASQFFDEI